MFHEMYGDQLGLLFAGKIPPGTTAPQNQPGKFESIMGAIRGGIDTYRETRGLPQYYPPQTAPQTRPRPPELPSTAPPVDTPPGDDQPQPQGFGISFDNQGLHIGKTITLSPTMLVLIGAGIFLYLREPPRRGGR